MKTTARYLFVLGLAVMALVTRVTAAETVLNVKDFGAIGDGKEHPVRELIASKRYSSWLALEKACPDVNEHWSVDEAACEIAKRKLPEDGGTIYFPKGHYVASAYGWKVMRDHVKFLGDGAEQTVLSTSASINDGLQLSGYRHVGWSRAYAFGTDEGTIGTTVITLSEPDAKQSFTVGDLVFVRNGANRYDQDFGEFNEVVSVSPEGQVTLKYPLTRNYAAAAINWGGKTASELIVPRVGSRAKVKLSTEAGCADPAPKTDVSIAGTAFRVERIEDRHVAVLVNTGHAGAPEGTVIPAGAVIAKERGIMRLTKSTRDFRCEKLTIRGRRKALNISNSFETSFTDCVFERVPAGATVTGGITIDGDGGRFAKFLRCVVRAEPAIGMQFARSFGGVTFEECRFVNTNVSFTEFNFDCQVLRSEFEVKGAPSLRSVIVVGKSCHDLRIVGNRITAKNVTTVFDAHTDIQSYKHSGERDLSIHDNVIIAPGVKNVFNLVMSQPVDLKGNKVDSSPIASAE